MGLSDFIKDSIEDDPLAVLAGWEEENRLFRNQQRAFYLWMVKSRISNWPLSARELTKLRVNNPWLEDNPEK